MTQPTRPCALLVAVAVAFLAGCTAATPDGPPEPDPSTSAQRAGLPYLDASLPTAARVADLLGRMDLADKVGQMTQAERSVVSPEAVAELRLGSVLSGGGSVPEPNTVEGWADLVDGLQQGALSTPLGIPILYGVDAVHGHNNLAGATVFPHNIGLGATRDPDLVEAIGRATAVEVAATGVDWTFAPCLCVVRDDRWGRSYESFGEDPAIVGAMTSVVTGLQTESLGSEPTSILATAKHYVGDGGTTGGTDQGDTELSEAELRAIHLAPYLAAIERGVGSVMVSFSSWNGDKLHGDAYLITDVLKGELGFDGFVVSDWAGVDQLDGAEGASRQDVVQAVNAGVDMVMVPYEYESFIATLTSVVEDGDVPRERIDDAVRRILTAKVELGLFEAPMTDRSLAGEVGSSEHRALARRAVAESLVVLQNSGALPIVEGARVLVTGSNADDVGNQSGGWTLTWQGASGDIVPGTTILEGLQEALGDDRVTYAPDAEDAEITAGDHDVAVAVVGETPYAEFEGDRPGGVRLSPADLALLDRLHAAGLPTVVVVVSGRPMDVTALLDWTDALVAAWLPGTEGAGVADVLTGAVRPSGTLPVSWPRSTDRPVNDGDGSSPLFGLGAGLTYEER
ncbi:glycoside hydrolase family 3 protein [Cellulomonas sp. KRMCY2]|uniref:glycoside hydrolase family 3 protein n=1 Tax=Cellulomonas sp. KRMCY2 TaxID=1304865 RepID=UPI00045E9BB0|nr:glycoside hydrolase family 3 N-terminal domain-containing protein [Cellulomonas sp. KRMCY2]